MERAAALRDLKLLVGSGGLDFTKGMDSLDEYVEQISFRQCITFCEHGQLKGWQPHFEPTVAKNSISTIVHCFGGSCCMETWGRLLQDATTNWPWPWRPQTKKSNRNFTVRGMTMSCLDRGRTTNFGYRKFTAENYSIPSLIHNSNIDPDDVRAGL